MQPAALKQVSKATLACILLLTTSLAGCLGGDDWNTIVTVPSDGTYDELNETIAEQDDQIQALQAALTEAQEQLASLQANHDALSEERDALAADLAAAQATIASLEAEIAALQNLLDSLQEDLTAAQALLEASGDNESNLDAEVADLEAEIASLQSQLADAQADIAALNASLNDNVTTVDDLSVQLAQADADILQLQSDLAGMNATVAALQSAYLGVQSGWSHTNQTMATLLSHSIDPSLSQIGACPIDNPPAVVVAGYDDGSGTGTAGDGVLEDSEIWNTTAMCTGYVGMVKDIKSGAGSSYAKYLTAVGSRIFFIAEDGVHGWELWTSDGTSAGTALVKDIGFVDSNPHQLTAVGSTLYFTAADSTHGRELWKSDGTSAGTVMVKDIGNPNCSSCTPNSAYPSNFTVIGNTLYFQADDGAWFGAQLWKTDGTSAGTVMLRSPGITPQELTAIGTILYFTNHDPIYGRELWWFDTTA